jgi:hypothetical protein
MADRKSVAQGYDEFIISQTQVEVWDRIGSHGFLIA